MKTKILSGFAALVLCVAVSATAQTTQYVTLNQSNLPIQTNQLVSVVGYDWTDKPPILGYPAGGGLINLTPYLTSFSQGSSSQTAYFSQIPQIATGMTNVSISGGWATFQITTPTTATVISNYVPADAIVIPASATGNVQIILESSPDLVNWTAASPGIYGASAGTNRFFRVRAAVSP
ncbi:MAG: hypothetical protein ABSC01_00965 [Verrucomicrobiota bacterium]|jgi:hypothetical protein